MSGDPYIKENDELRAEIARLQRSKDEWIKQAAEMEAQRDKLRAALEEISVRNPGSKDGDIARKALAKERKWVSP